MSEAMMPLCLVSMDWEFLKKKNKRSLTQFAQLQLGPVLQKSVSLTLVSLKFETGFSAACL